MPRNIYDEDHEAFRASVKEFVERMLVPRAEEMIRDHTIPREVWLEAGKQGFFGLTIPEEFGGAGIDDYRFNAVLAEEINPPKGETPLKWLLLTSEPVESLAQALRVIDIYTHRWRIEEFHKAWKTGAGAERQRMEEPDNLERMVSILSFVAVRL